MTIHAPRNLSSRLPAHFALGATISVVAAIVVGAVAFDREDRAPTGDQGALNRPAIIVSEDGIRASEAALQDAFGSSVSIASTEDSIRRGEVWLDAALRDAFNLPGAPVVMAPAQLISPLPPHALGGPAYP